MKIYEVNNELESILLKQDLVATTSERDKKKGKKSFKKTKQSRKEIFFDHIQIRILNGIGQDSRIKITQSELKALILYFKLNSTDFKELEPNGQFNFENTLEGLKSFKKEVEKLTELNLNKPRRTKLLRILNTYENINLY